MLWFLFACASAVEDCTDAWALTCDMCPDLASTMIDCDNPPDDCEGVDAPPVEWAARGCSLPMVVALGGA